MKNFSSFAGSLMRCFTKNERSLIDFPKNRMKQRRRVLDWGLRRSFQSSRRVSTERGNFSRLRTFRACHVVGIKFAVSGSEVVHALVCLTMRGKWMHLAWLSRNVDLSSWNIRQVNKNPQRTYLLGMWILYCWINLIFFLYTYFHKPINELLSSLRERKTFIQCKSRL